MQEKQNDSEMYNDDEEIEKILEKGEKFYPITEESEKTDEKCDKIYTIDNWAEVFYHIKEGESKKRFIELMNNYEYSKFFEGMNYEYGINNCPLDLEKALTIYKQGANNNDVMCMFRLYHLYKKDYIKFNKPKRNRLYEKFYLFKCYAFLRYPLIDRDQYLLNRFNIPYELSIHFEYEDEDFTIFHKFIKFLKENHKIYEMNLDDLELMQLVIDFNLNENANKISILERLKQISANNLEALYKLACFIRDEKEKEKNFRILREKKYYRSYVDYGLYLNKKKRYKEALEILGEARENGIVPAGYLYYDIYLESNDFSLLMNEAVSSSFSKECKLYDLFEILRDDILTESVYSFFEFIFLRKICVKHYKLEEGINKYFFNFTKEMSDFLIKITEESNIKKKKETIKKYFCQENDYQEFHLACGTLYYYGIKNIVEINNNIAYNKFLPSFFSSRSNSYKRFCFSYIYKIKKKLYELNKLNQNNNSDANAILNEEEIKKSEKVIFNMYNEASLKDKISNLSSSFFYYLSRLYHNKIGNNGDQLLEYIYLEKAKDYINDSPGSGSIICIYRKHKTKLLLEKNKDDYSQILNNIVINRDSEGYGEDGDLCPICFEIKRNEVALPCRHLFCEFCINKLTKCPICRRPIIMKHFIG